MLNILTGIKENIDVICKAYQWKLSNTARSGSRLNFLCQVKNDGCFTRAVLYVDPDHRCTDFINTMPEDNPISKTVYLSSIKQIHLIVGIFINEKRDYWASVVLIQKSAPCKCKKPVQYCWQETVQLSVKRRLEQEM